MKKYPRTPHFQFSPEIKSDDKVIHFKHLGNFLQNEIIITEKLDGGNCCLNPNKGVFARSHGTTTDCPSFDYIKNIHYYSKLHLFNPNYLYFGENMYAIHSIKYEKLNDYFYLFNIFDIEKKHWLNYEELQRESEKLNFQLVPILFKGKIDNIDWLNQWMNNEIHKESFFSGKREGFVTKCNIHIKENEFNEYCAKYVRKGHVQTDEHWSKNWKVAKLVN